MTNHPKDAHISDSASGGKGESMASEIRKFRKKPVVVEAVQWFKHGDHPAVQAYSPDTVGNYPGYRACGFIETLESQMFHVIPGDWIITGIKGEHYACKADIFAATYEAVLFRISEESAPSSEARPGVGTAVEEEKVDEKGLASRVEELENALVNSLLDHISDCGCITCKRTERVLAKNPSSPPPIDSASGSTSNHSAKETRKGTSDAD